MHTEMYSESAYGGFWRRLFASLIDGVILGAVQGLLFPVLARTDVGAALGAPGFGILAGLMYWLYFAGLEGSLLQATAGKMVMHLEVTDGDGRPIGFGHASLRHFAKILSSLLLGFGWLMAAFTPRKQALHDLLAGTLVIRAGMQAGVGRAQIGYGQDGSLDQYSAYWDGTQWVRIDPGATHSLR
jgi:uncharacterized RDD family membrane protein YckC